MNIPTACKVDSVHATVCLLCWIQFYLLLKRTALLYEGWNFNSGKYLFTTDTK